MSTTKEAQKIKVSLKKTAAAAAAVVEKKDKHEDEH
jgi:hypothetical protein